MFSDVIGGLALGAVFILAGTIVGLAALRKKLKS